MKRKSGKIIALILSLTVMLGLFASCGLITVNVDKDLSQTVATVEVTDYDKTEGYKKEYANVYKRELVTGYVSYGYYYEMYYGYTTEQAYELVLDSIINNKVLVQYSLTQIEKTYTRDEAELATVLGYLNLPEASLCTDYSAEKIAYAKTLVKYLDNVQIAEAGYNARVSVNSVLDTLDTSVDTDAADEEEDETFTTTVPTVEEADGELVDEEYVKNTAGLEEGVTVEELEKDAAAKDDYDAWLIKKYTRGYSLVATTVARQSAVSEFVDTFTENGLVSEEEYNALVEAGKQYNIGNYAYYVDLIVSSLEASVIANFEEQLTDEAKADVAEDNNYDGLWAEYKSAYETQKANYANDTAAYEAALDAAASANDVLYHPASAANGYGYVANLLIGFSDAQTAALNAYKAVAASKTAVTAYRAELLNNLVATDQRGDWLRAGHDYDEAEGFGDDYVKTAALKKFNGTFVATSTEKTETSDMKFYYDATAEGEDKWVWGKEETTETVVTYTGIAAKEVPFGTFYDNTFVAVLGASKAAIVTEGYYGEGKIDLDDAKLDAINDLLFAYGTDPGSLNNYLGYLYSPSKETTYVSEFSKACEYVLSQPEGTYVVVATDYGYHIVINTKKIAPSKGYYAGLEDEAQAKAAFVADINNEKKDSGAYSFYQTKIDSNIEKLVSDEVTYRISKFIDEEENYVQKIEKTLKNLISFEEEDEK